MRAKAGAAVRAGGRPRDQVGPGDALRVLWHLSLEGCVNADLQRGHSWAEAEAAAMWLHCCVG